jgi:hypothetical protein
MSEKMKTQPQLVLFVMESRQETSCHDTTVINNFEGLKYITGHEIITNKIIKLPHEESECAKKNSIIMQMNKQLNLKFKRV